MAHYHAAVESRSSATETFGWYLAPVSTAAEWDAGVLRRGAAGSRPGHRQPLPAGGAVPGAAHAPDLRGHQVRAGPGGAPARSQPDREVLLHAANGVLRSTDRIVVKGRRGRLDGQL